MDAKKTPLTNMETLVFSHFSLRVLRDRVTSCDPAEMEQRMFSVCLSALSSGELGRLLHLLFAPISTPALLFLLYSSLWDLLVCGRIWIRSCRASSCSVNWILSKDKNNKRSARRAGYALISVFPETPPCWNSPLCI